VATAAQPEAEPELLCQSGEGGGLSEQQIGVSEAEKAKKRRAKKARQRAARAQAAPQQVPNEAAQAEPATQQALNTAAQSDPATNQVPGETVEAEAAAQQKTNTDALKQSAAQEVTDSASQGEHAATNPSSPDASQDQREQGPDTSMAAGASAISGLPSRAPAQSPEQKRQQNGIHKPEVGAAGPKMSSTGQQSVQAAQATRAGISDSESWQEVRPSRKRATAQKGPPMGAQNAKAQGKKLPKQAAAPAQLPLSAQLTSPNADWADAAQGPTSPQKATRMAVTPGHAAQPEVPMPCSGQPATTSLPGQEAQQQVTLASWTLSCAVLIDDMIGFMSHATVHASSAMVQCQVEFVSLQVAAPVNCAESHKDDSDEDLCLVRIDNLREVPLHSASFQRLHHALLLPGHEPM